jgi:hypothetical protein
VQFRRLRDFGDFATLRRPTAQRRPGQVFGCFILVCPIYYHHRKTGGLEFSKFCERKEWVQEVPVYNSPIIACPVLTKFAPAKRSCGEKVMGQAVLGSIFVMTCWQRTIEMRFSRIEDIDALLDRSIIACFRICRDFGSHRIHTR